MERTFASFVENSWINESFDFFLVRGVGASRSPQNSSRVVLPQLVLTVLQVDEIKLSFAITG
jgi:hypothetical protein